MIGEFSIGSTTWPGAGKVIEESGELQQILGKLIGSSGDVEHFDGTNLKARLESEIGDLTAALRFFVEANELDAEAIGARHDEMVALFRQWSGFEFTDPVTQ